MQHTFDGITQTLGARLMAMQAQLLAERAGANRSEWVQGFDDLMHGPEAQLLSSIWTREQRRAFRHYMMGVRAGIERQEPAQLSYSAPYPMPFSMPASALNPLQ